MFDGVWKVLPHADTELDTSQRSTELELKMKCIQAMSYCTQ